MTEPSDQEYFAARAEVERMMSNSALDPNIASIHAQLADSYERLAAELGQQRPAPRMPAASPPYSQENDSR